MKKTLPNDEHEEPDSMCGEVIEGRFSIRRKLSTGIFGTVWEGLDLKSGKRVAIKLYRKDQPNALVAKYLDHLRDVQSLLAGHNVGGVILPIATGQTENWVYHVFEYVEHTQTLEDAIAQSAPMNPSEAFKILEQVSTAVEVLHARSIIHGDIKPANILLSQRDRGAYLIDLGMAHPIGPPKSILFVGTPRYAAPGLIASTRQELDADTTAALVLQREIVGPYIDLYALGIVTLEMLTSTADPPVPLSAWQMVEHLRVRNPWLAICDEEVLNDVSNLLIAMLSVRPGRDQVSAQKVVYASRTLADTFRQSSAHPAPTAKSEQATLPSSAARAEFQPLGELRGILRKFESLSEELDAKTAMFLAEAGTLRSVGGHERDEQILAEINAVFGNALRRAQNTWTLGVAMTIATFALIIVMIASAVILTIVTGRAWWALIFGGASIPVTIGTLLWRPYDRVFRATILTQQIEMIHVQTTAGFRGTSDLKERMTICREAVSALQSMLREETSAEAAKKARGIAKLFPKGD